MIPEYRNTGNKDQDDSDNIGSIIALDDTSDMAMVHVVKTGGLLELFIFGLGFCNLLMF